MNLVLLFPSDFISPGIVSLAGRRLRHVLEVLRPKEGSVLTVGIEGGNLGKGKVIEINERVLIMEVVLLRPPVRKLPVVLCIALMRPIVFKRILLTAVSMGVEEIVIFHSSSVEKSFWQSTVLEAEAIRGQVILGLEQAKDTILPRVRIEKKFKPFVEDVLPEILKGRTGIVADPDGDTNNLATITSIPAAQPVVCVIGPEGGFIPYEIMKFREAGCQIINLGERILRVETAMVFLLSKCVA